ncbi:hypothetical protein [Sphingopyxis sp. H115]|uniref:hypothetical protein n=1 Tax=Sphingopyxis sp. H115 TaxID=1759073 RepID=UPI0007368DA7|nr:hypothetical protein [Sphingopyxis sp. H115]KTE17484.1 hypothetical protein ATE71_02955 [Sphingopyxis sp. H115]
MEDTPALLPSLLIAVAAGAGAWLLRRSWQARQRQTGLVALGWLLIVAATILPAWLLGPARGPFVALAIVPVAALAVVAANYTVRQAKARAERESLAPEPSDRATTKGRETLRWLLAGPIGMIAAMGVGIAWAALVPGEQQTRLVVGGLLVPLIWGGCMAWTLADNRILRATAVLTGVAIISFTAAIVKGFA